MRKTLVLLYICLAVAPICQAVARLNQERVRVKGVLLDPSEACIVGGTIIFENRHTKLRVYSNDEGVFDAQLPPGSYELIVETIGFKRFQIGSLEVKSPGIQNMKIRLEPEPVKDHPYFDFLDVLLVPQKAPIADIKPRKIE